jgi:hypothetical protein
MVRYQFYNSICMKTIIKKHCGSGIVNYFLDSDRKDELRWF